MLNVIASVKVWPVVLGGVAVAVAVVLAVLSSSGEPESVVQPVGEEHAALPPEPADPGPSDDVVAEVDAALAAAARESGPARTRRTGLVTLPLEDEIRIKISRDGLVTYGDLEVRAKKNVPPYQQSDRLSILEGLFVAADAARDFESPSQPSTRNLLLDFDGNVPWWLIRFAGHLVADPAVRIYRVHWSVLPADGGAEAGLPIFFLTDRGLAVSGHRLYGNPRPRVALIRESGDGVTTVRFLGVKLGHGEAGLLKLEERVPALFEAIPDADFLIDPRADVPVADVVRALDLIPGELRFGHTMVTNGLENLVWLSSSSEEALQLLRNELEVWKLDYDGALLDAYGDPSGGFLEFLTAHRTAEEIVGLYERLLARKSEDLPEIRRLLTRQKFQFREIRQLDEKARLDRFILLGLARGYLARKQEGDCLSAATLAGLVATASPRLAYTPSWWTCQFLVVRGLIGHAEQTEDRVFLTEAQALLEILGTLATVAGTPYSKEFEAIEQEAERVAGWMR